MNEPWPDSFPMRSITLQPSVTAHMSSRGLPSPMGESQEHGSGLRAGTGRLPCKTDSARREREEEPKKDRKERGPKLNKPHGLAPSHFSPECAAPGPRSFLFGTICDL